MLGNTCPSVNYQVIEALLLRTLHVNKTFAECKELDSEVKH